MNTVKPKRNGFKKSNFSGSKENNTTKNTPRANYKHSPSKSYDKALQARDRYLMMAREAKAGGDTIAAESYLQHADHYSRIIVESREMAKKQPRNEESTTESQ
jgi:hypothetical protein